MSAEDSIPLLTNEFVSELIGKRVKSFTIKLGAAPGFTSSLYCLKCILDDEENSVIYGISKCYPAHGSRQEFLNKTNIFWKELCVYKEWTTALKDLLKNQPKHGAKMALPFAPLISGQSPNFGSGKDQKEILKKFEGKVFSPFEIYVMMVDMKNTFGFRMADRMIGLGLEEMNLVMKEYAKVHALSWAYKCKFGIENYDAKFSYFKMDTSEESMATWIGYMVANLNIPYDILRKLVKPEESAILKGLSKILEKSRVKEIMDCMYHSGETGSNLEGILRVPLKKTEEERAADEVPWQVVVHGDCWVNNLLFRYDPVTKKPIELVLIDLQLMRDACPTVDLVYSIYTNTTRALREKHLKDWLRLYSEQFIFHCDSLGVPYLPGFSYESLVRRFHRSKLVGLMMGLIVFPVMLKEDKGGLDMDRYTDDTDLDEIVNSEMGGLEKNVTYKERLYALAQEMYEDGVI